MLKKIIICIVLILFLGRIAIAQGDQYRFSRLSIDNGLSHNWVTCIYKDARGFMWFGTKSGLNRYDGFRFKTFKHDVNDKTSVNDDYIVSITSGPENKLWIKTRKGFNIYDPITDRFENNVKTALRQYGLPDTLLIDLNKDRSGNFWFTYRKSGLFKFNPTQVSSTHLINKPGDTTTVRLGTITDFAEDHQGNLWLIYNDGVLEQVNRQTNRVVKRNYGLSNRYPGEKIEYQISVDQQDDIWAFSHLRAHGVWYVSPKTNTFKQFGKTVGQVKMSSDIVFNVIQDHTGLIWVATDHGGISLIDKTNFKVQQILNRPDDDRSLSQDCVVSIYRDNADIIWLGTFKQGINYYHPDIIKFPLYRRQATVQNSLTYDDVNAFAEDKAGNLWLGTDGGGLIYFNRKTGSYKTYLHGPDPNTLGNNVITSLCIDHKDRLWIGTYFGGLDVFDGQTFRHYKHLPGDVNSLSDNTVLHILEDSKNRLWVGTLAGGLNVFNPEKQNFYRYPIGSVNAVPSSIISGLMEDDQGNIWISTHQGLAVLQKASNRFKHYHHTEGDQESLSNDNASNLMMDSRKLIWIATNEGLNVFNPKTGKFKSFGKRDGLPDNVILKILEDRKHNLWISTPNGLSNMVVTAKKGSYTFTFRNYDQTDGLQGKEFNEDAAFKTRRGELIFGGGNGFNLFKPESIQPTKEKPVLVLTDFQLFYKSLHAGEQVNNHVILHKSITETKNIVLRYNENVISIEFALVNFFNPSKVKMAYMLDGFDKDWIIADHKVRKANYTNLDQGKYVFRLKASGEDGKWNNDQIALEIKVLPPIWRTNVAYALYILLFVCALLYIRYLGIRKLKNNFAIEQERQEVQRMRDLDLMKIKFFTNVSHEFRTPLALILAPADKLLNQSQEPELRKHLHMINRNGKRLLNLVNQLLDFRKMEVNELRLNLKQFDSVKFIEELVYAFNDVAEHKSISLNFNTNLERLVASFDPDKVERILFNLLSNAFKFTYEGGCIEVKLEIIDSNELQFLKIDVIDSGIGIPEEKLEKVFERFFQHDVPGSMVNQGSGIGLAITREFVHLHKGVIKASSRIDKGSCFTVLLPLNLNSELPHVQPVITHVEQSESSIKNDLVEKNTDVAAKSAKFSSKLPLILLIEDNDDFRFYLKDNLQAYYQIVEAVNGKDGWQKALSAHPDLIVSDISMPEMSGIELCQKIKADNRTTHIPFILLTAATGKDEELKGLETGANDYLTKPFNFEILNSKIKNLLQQQLTLKKTYQKRLDIDTALPKMDVSDDKFMKDVMSCIEKRLDDPGFSVEELSSAMAMSRVTLYRKVLQMTDRSPVEFIKLVRLKQAAQLLENTQLNISEIAYKVGFNNPKYFARSFKIEFNLLPTDYRQELIKKKDELLTDPEI